MTRMTRERRDQMSTSRKQMVIGSWIFFRKERTLLIHGVEADWIEEEMADDDVDFIKDVLETKIKTAFQKAGLVKKVSFLQIFRWKAGPLHRSQPPVVVIFRNWSDQFINKVLDQGDSTNQVLDQEDFIYNVLDQGDFTNQVLDQ